MLINLPFFIGGGDGGSCLFILFSCVHKHLYIISELREAFATECSGGTKSRANLGEYLYKDVIRFDFGPICMRLHIIYHQEINVLAIRTKYNNDVIININSTSIHIL